MIKDHKLRLTTLNVSMRMLVFDLFDEIIKCYIDFCWIVFCILYFFLLNLISS